MLLILGFASVRHSLAGVVKRGDPQRAHALAPGDGRITALAAEQRLVALRSPSDQLTRTLAQRALLQDPTAVKAVETLGMQAQMGNDAVRARRLFAYAQTLTRRELQTHLWGIEDAVVRNDIPAVLRHYDMALRTSKNAPDILYPVLTAALGETEVRARLVDVLARKPLWGPGFVAHAAGSTENPLAVAMLFQGLAKKGYPISATAQTGVVNNLIVSGQIETGWRYYVSIRPDADRRRSRDPDFAADLEAPSVLDWIPVNDEGIVTSIQEEAFNFGVPPSVGGMLLRQMQLLSPGAYRLEGKSNEIEQTKRALPYWLLTCQNGRELGRVVVPNSSQNGGAFAGRFTVPRDCPVQTLTLVARPSDEITGLSGQIRQARLVPARSAR